MTCWYVYLIECVDGSIYTGIAVDVDRRYAQHLAGKGARYTRSWPPARLLARFEYPDRSAASRAEYAIKRLTPSHKRALCDPDAGPDAIAPRAPRTARTHPQYEAAAVSTIQRVQAKRRDDAAVGQRPQDTGE